MTETRTMRSLPGDPGDQAPSLAVPLPLEPHPPILKSPRCTADGLAGLEAFLAEVRPKLKRLLASLKVPIDDADDVLQDSLVALLLAGPDGLSNPEAWLLGTLRHKILLYFRRRQRQRRCFAKVANAAPASEPAPQERQDLLRDLSALAARLPERDVVILSLRLGLGLKPREVAKILRCQPDSVRKLTRRALERARRQLAQSRDPNGLRRDVRATASLHLPGAGLALSSANTAVGAQIIDPIAVVSPIQASSDRGRDAFETSLHRSRRATPQLPPRHRL
jgi:RNA polymerase sigma factor (sigma-70 family)